MSITSHCQVMIYIVVLLGKSLFCLSGRLQLCEDFHNNFTIKVWLTHTVVMVCKKMNNIFYSIARLPTSFPNSVFPRQPMSDT